MTDDFIFEFFLVFKAGKLMLSPSFTLGFGDRCYIANKLEGRTTRRPINLSEDVSIFK